MGFYRHFPQRQLAGLVVLFVSIFSLIAFSHSNLPASGPFPDDQAKKYRVFAETSVEPVAFDSKKQKLDASARMLLNTSGSRRMMFLAKKSHLSVNKDASGRLTVDLFIQLNDQSALSKLLALGIEYRTQVGDIVIARAAVEALTALAQEPGVRRVEVSQKREAALDSSRVDIGAHLVHQGTDLPQAYQGEGVIVGVIDSGIDFTHVDFSNQNGSRIQHLLEFTEGGGQNEWAKSDIDNNPGSITQIDGNGSGGHGTHVTGIAAGGGQLNSAMMGMAPASDIIFVKGIRNPDSDGGFGDADVIAGCQFIFDKADQMGKPAVINLSLGGHAGPHDGTSLYEQSLDNLMGPGKIIVAAAGNSGSDFIHAGGSATAGVINETIVEADSSEQLVRVDMWYEPSVISDVAVFVYDDQLNFLTQTPSLDVGQFMNSEPVVVNNDTVGFVAIDAQTLADPNNGDGNVIFIIHNDDNPSIDISDLFWGIGSISSSNGRLDMWLARGGKFRDQPVGFVGETEMPGNNDYSVGIPSTAQKVIAVGSYVTKNSWIDVDDRSLTLNPAPTIADRSTFSSKGPTRDERTSPDIAAPGQLIFSALSSHLTEGVGYQRAFALQGGGYLGQNGTSQASPHVAGTVALMLQVKNDLTYSEAVQVFSETARTNQFTGTTPNDNVGAGYLDAHAAVKKVVDIVGSIEDPEIGIQPEDFVLKQNYPNPFNPTTTIEYTLNKTAHALIKIYNIYGQEIITLVDQKKPSGTFSLTWDGKNGNGQQVATGVYYFRLKAADFAATRKMVLLR